MIFSPVLSKSNEAFNFLPERTMGSLLWNLSIKNKNIVGYQFKSVFQTLAEAPKNATISQMLGVWCDVGTYIGKQTSGSVTFHP